MMSCDSIDSLSTVVSEEGPEAPKEEPNFAEMFGIGETDASLFEIGEPDDLVAISKEPTLQERASSVDAAMPREVEIIEEEPTKPSHKRRLSFSDQIFGQAHKFFKTAMDNDGMEFRVTTYQPTIHRATYEPLRATDDNDNVNSKKPKQESSTTSTTLGASLIPTPTTVKDRWGNFVANTPTAAPRLSVAPPASFKWGPGL